MKNQNAENYPSKEALIKDLEIQWTDHSNIRNQTWKTLHIEAALFIGLIGIDYQNPNPMFTKLAALILFISTIVGSAVTIHHRFCQNKKFDFINKIEVALGLQHPDIKDDLSSEFKKRKLRFFKNSTHIFILSMHIALAAFAVIFFIKS